MLDALLAEVFPFHLRVDAELRVVAMGPSIKKVFPGEVAGTALGDLIQVVYPRVELAPAALVEKRRDTFICHIDREGFRLRGQMLPLEDGGFAYLCSPWIDDPAVMVASGITESDFAPHESSVDHMYLMFTRAKQIAEMNEMNTRLKDSLHESEQRAAAEAALTRDLEVAADLRIQVIDDVVGAVHVNAPSLAPLCVTLKPGIMLADSPGWLVTAMREAQTPNEAAVHAVRATVDCCGEQRLLDLRVSRLSEREAILLGRDSTEDQAEHLLLLQTLEQAMEAVVMVDDDGQITFFNQAAREMFGYAR